MNQPCKIRARSSGPVAIIDLEGDLTHTCEGALLAALHTPAAANQPWILLNFRLVGYINSAGISLLVSLLSDLRIAGRHLMACSLSPHFQKIFRMVGLTMFLQVHDSEQEALAAATTQGH
ncbi:MAG: STAS domain-containing protein [Chloroflexi bacterium]|nr:STAS domain-containing protein [Chloroflexota bacterium]